MIFLKGLLWKFALSCLLSFCLVSEPSIVIDYHNLSLIPTDVVDKFVQTTIDKHMGNLFESIDLRKNVESETFYYSVDQRTNTKITGIKTH